MARPAPQLDFGLENYTDPEIFQLHALSQRTRLQICTHVLPRIVQMICIYCWESLRLQIEAIHKAIM
jgi:hypothetical protein